MMHYLFRLTCGLLMLSMSLAGCSLFDPVEPQPIFLKLAESQVRVANPSGVIVDQQGLRDFWLDHNGAQLGVYRTGRVIPLLPDPDRNELTIRGGIFANGLSGIRNAYPFWQPITLQLDAEPLDTVELDLTFEYFPRDSIVVYPLEETFETGGTDAFISRASQPNSTLLTPTTLDIYQGDRSGRVRFTPNQHDFEANSRELFALRRSSDNDIYLELTYRNTVPFTVELFFVNRSQTNLLSLPTGVQFLSPDSWNTVYVHLLPLVQSTQEDGAYQIRLRANSRDSQTGEVQSGDVFLDNIRLVTFSPGR